MWNILRSNYVDLPENDICIILFDWLETYPHDCVLLIDTVRWCYVSMHLIEKYNNTPLIKKSTYNLINLSNVHYPDRTPYEY
ncbi:hypothetical protein BTW14_gp194 [BeAn 58058 virus]|uniref:hypothetical protein n=1 Tax=BeAn 58058 virus TaxID=67082 RepID=UPI00090C2C9E|nr:hypothetical protein BTW14_gp194 [BeAn 58058 virus]APG58385.1 hypothetical protein BAV00212 [BeAn 58058 virus]